MTNNIRDVEALVRRAGLSFEKIEGRRESPKNICAPVRIISCQIIDNVSIHHNKNKQDILLWVQVML